MMLVETYECEETSEETVEMTDEALAIIESCGLEGQKKMLRKDSDGETKRCPYRKMLKDELQIYSILCPDKTTAAKYAGSPIPLRVLQVLAHADSLDFFDELQIWDKESADIKDPVLVGIEKPNSENSHTTTHYILARWGEELDEMPALRNRAVRMKREQLQSAADSIRRKAEAYRADSMSDEQVLAASVPWSYHWD